MGDLSKYFSKKEFTCKCCGSCIGPAGELIFGLEKLRAEFYPRGLIIRSGYRCPTHNRRSGGARVSQHLFGAAADIDLRVPLEKVLALGAFSGIGYQRVGELSLVRHVDVRHASGHNTTGSTISSPAIWEYPSVGPQ